MKYHKELFSIFSGIDANNNDLKSLYRNIKTKFHEIRSEHDKLEELADTESIKAVAKYMAILKINKKVFAVGNLLRSFRMLVERELASENPSDRVQAQPDVNSSGFLSIVLKKCLAIAHDHQSLKRLLDICGMDIFQMVDDIEGPPTWERFSVKIKKLMMAYNGLIEAKQRFPEVVKLPSDIESLHKEAEMKIKDLKKAVYSGKLTELLCYDCSSKLDDFRIALVHAIDLTI